MFRPMVRGEEHECEQPFLPVALILLASAAVAQDKLEVLTQLGHTDWVESIAFSPDGHTALSGSFDQTKKLWDVATGRKDEFSRESSEWAMGAFTYARVRTALVNS
jgi:hypothetical protein